MVNIDLVDFVAGVRDIRGAGKVRQEETVYRNSDLQCMSSPVKLFCIAHGARGVVVASGIILRVGRPRVRFPLRSLDFSLDLTLPAALWP
jgi:hypothetical protein